MRLLSVRVGGPVTYAVPTAEATGPTTLTTAIVKHEVAGPVRLTRLGLAGDQVADTRNHGGADQALLAYAAEHYPRWREEWGVEPEVVGLGGFGENLTVSDADESSVALGDRWRIGEVLLEVTKPRTPCVRLAWRHGRDDLIQQVHDTGRSGWYLRVLAEGTLASGADIVLESRSCPGMTVRRAALAMAHRDRAPDEARALLRCDALAADWRYRLAKEGFRRA